MRRTLVSPRGRLLRRVRPSRGSVRASAALVAAWLLSACGSTAGIPIRATIGLPESEPERQLALLQEIDSLLADNYVYPDFGGSAWQAEFEAARQRVASGLEDDAFRQDVRELLAALPEGTASYLTRDERLAGATAMADPYEGIGAFIAFRAEPEPRLLVLAVVEGSPADLSGLKPHDVILAVDGRAVAASEGIDAAGRIRGPLGSLVRLDVRSPLEGRRQIEVLRQSIVAVDAPRGRVMTTGAVHLQVPVAAGAGLVDNIATALEALAQEPDGSGLVLDLRIAASHDGWPLEEALGLFLEGGNGAFIRRSGPGPLEIIGTDVQGSQSVPLVVLVGPDTRGAPEIFAAEIQASRRGVVIGRETPGQFFAYASRVLSDGSELTYADSSYRTTQGLDLGASGVRPNIPVDADWDQVTDTLDPVLATALALLEE